MTTVRNFGFTDMDYAVFKDDFFNYVAADWTVTTTELGTGSATEAIQDESFGVLKLTNAAGDNDLDFLQATGTMAESFKYVSGKRLAFKARFKVLEVIQCDWVMGLQITDTTPLAVTDGIYFQSDDGDAFVDFHVAKDSTATDATALASMTADTYHTVEFYADGTNPIDYFFDGVHIGSAVLTNVPDDEELTISFGIQNGAAVVNTMSIDYITVAQER